MEHASPRSHPHAACKVFDQHVLTAPQKLTSLVGVHRRNPCPFYLLFRQIVYLSSISEDLPSTKKKRVDLLGPLPGDLRQRPVLDRDFIGTARTRLQTEK